jgi:GNAT superfamily N-acetyltransferase
VNDADLAAIAVRPARPADAESVFALLTAFATSYRPRREAFDTLYPRLTHPAGSGILLVAEAEGAVIGYALAHRLLVLYANGAVCELQELMVEPAHRGRGVGRRLVAAVERYAADAGAAEVAVPTRRARDFYLRLGFEETATYLKRPLG